MEELLIPSEGEETNSEPTAFTPAGPARSPKDRFSGCFTSMLSPGVKRYLRNYLKRNGLLTLSVMAVITGCVLGFMLRGQTVSTQVCPLRSPL